MTQPRFGDGHRALRRAAVEALSFTPLAGEQPEQAIGVDPSPRSKADLLYATSLVDIYAAFLGMSYELALDALTSDAARVYAARREALVAWTKVCSLVGDNLSTQVSFLATGRSEPTVTAYADAADITYDQACHNLYLLHAPTCASHGHTTRAKENK